jgi:hypothetical protein
MGVAMVKPSIPIADVTIRLLLLKKIVKPYVQQAIYANILPPLPIKLIGNPPIIPASPVVRGLALVV